MQPDLITQASTLVYAYLVPFVWKLLGALAVWIVGSWVIRLLRVALEKTLVARKVDPTLARYVEAGANVMMKLLLFIAVLSVLGIETTSFAALLAAFGIAIGAAWSGLLANFAAGMFLMVLRPFKVGDMISAGGVSATCTRSGCSSRHRHGRQHPRLRRQQQDLLRLDPELHYQRLPPRRPEGADRAQREPL